MKYLCLFVGKNNLRLDVVEGDLSLHYGRDIVRVPWYSEYSRELHIMWTVNLTRLTDNEFEIDINRVFRIIESLNSPDIVTFTYSRNESYEITESRYKGYLHSLTDPAQAVYFKGENLGSFNPRKHLSYRYYEFGILKKHMNRTQLGFSIDYYESDGSEDPRNVVLIKSEYHEPNLRVVDWNTHNPIDIKFFESWYRIVCSSGMYTLKQSPKENVVELIRGDKIMEVKVPASLIRIDKRHNLPKYINDAMHRDILTLEELSLSEENLAKFKKYFKLGETLTSSQCLKQIKTRLNKPLIPN